MTFYRLIEGIQWKYEWPMNDPQNYVQFHIVSCCSSSVQQRLKSGCGLHWTFFFLDNIQTDISGKRTVCVWVCCSDHKEIQREAKKRFIVNGRTRTVEKGNAIEKQKLVFISSLSPTSSFTQRKTGMSVNNFTHERSSRHQYGLYNNNTSLCSQHKRPHRVQFR